MSALLHGIRYQLLPRFGGGTQCIHRSAVSLVTNHDDYHNSRIDNRLANILVLFLLYRPIHLKNSFAIPKNYLLLLLSSFFKKCDTVQVSLNNFMVIGLV